MTRSSIQSIAPLNIDDLAILIQSSDYRCELHYADDDEDCPHLVMGPAPFKLAPDSFDPERIILMDISYANDTLKAAGHKAHPFFRQLNIFHSFAL